MSNQNNEWKKKFRKNFQKSLEIAEISLNVFPHQRGMFSKSIESFIEQLLQSEKDRTIALERERDFQIIHEIIMNSKFHEAFDLLELAQKRILSDYNNQ